ncbi:MAG: NAD-dependent epimerase/dehydratase family protein [Pseudomonadota bacterium]
MADRRILVTGRGGFIGRPTVRALERQGFTVHDGPRRDLLTPKGRADLIKEANADILLHLAWVTEHGKFWTSPLNAAWEEASLDLFRRFYDAGGGRVVATGSCAEYDWSTGAEAFDEADPLNPHTEYGAAKLRTGQALAQITAEFDRSAAWARLFFMFGPGEPLTRLIPLMITATRSGDRIECGPADTIRDFWHVDRLGQALAILAASNLDGPVNLGSGQPIRFDQVGAIIEEVFAASGCICFDRRPLGQGEPIRLVAGTRRSSELGLPVADLKADLVAYCRTFGS